MPLYEYRCLDCNEEYEKREGFDAPALQKCPNCGGTARRVLHAPPIVFKGSGFYVTDSRKAAAGSASAPEAEKEASTGSAGAASGEAKPSSESKAETKTSKDDAKPAEPAAAS